MSFTFPNKTKFTIYTKSECKFCTSVKMLLEDSNIEYDSINCDDYLKNDRDDFLMFIKSLTNREWKTFPMVFDNQAQFIGGFNETQNYLPKILNFDDKCDF